MGSLSSNMQVAVIGCVFVATVLQCHAYGKFCLAGYMRKYGRRFLKVHTVAVTVEYKGSRPWGREWQNRPTRIHVTQFIW